ncbi:MAG: hypothetical protein GXO39_04585 [Thermotogae bacterium]|nr:hypothetical protein [Thermotogota bacterium]
MKKLSFLLLLVATPVLGSVWTEVAGGVWLPFFGAFRTNHNIGVQGHVRAGFEFRFDLPQDIANLLPAGVSNIKSFSPLLEVYHTWNSLKEPVWEVQDGDTIKSGNMFYVGAGGRIKTGKSEAYSIGATFSLGLVTEYAPTGDNIIGGGGHAPPKFSPSAFLSLFVSYEALKPLYFLAEYNTETLGDFSYGYTGWHEVSVGVGLRF